MLDPDEACHPSRMSFGGVGRLLKSSPSHQVDDQFGHLNRIVLGPHVQDQNGDAGLELQAHVAGGNGLKLRDVPDATVRAIWLLARSPAAARRLEIGLKGRLGWLRMG